MRASMGATRALVIGRFQPPHNGHLACLEAAAAAADEVLVAVGSAQKSHTPNDLFTAGERIQMLAELAQEADLPVRHVVPVPDLDQYHLWTAQVRGYLPPFDLVVTGSPMTEHLFAREGIPVQRIPVTKRAAYQGTTLRRRLLAGEAVDDAVPPAVAAFLAREGIQVRIRALAAAAEGAQG